MNVSWVETVGMGQGGDCDWGRWSGDVMGGWRGAWIWDRVGGEIHEMDLIVLMSLNGSIKVSICYRLVVLRSIILLCWVINLSDSLTCFLS